MSDDKSFAMYIEHKDKEVIVTRNGSRASFIMGYDYNPSSLKYISPEIYFKCGGTCYSLCVYICNNLLYSHNAIVLDLNDAAKFCKVDIRTIKNAIAKLRGNEIIYNIKSMNIQNIDCDKNLYVVHPKFVWHGNSTRYLYGLQQFSYKLNTAVTSKKGSITVKVDSFDIIDALACKYYIGSATDVKYETVLAEGTTNQYIAEVAEYTDDDDLV